MFKRQDNDKRGKVCGKNFCEILIIPHNLTNKIQLLDISANNTARSFISGRYNYWPANEVLLKFVLNSLLPRNYLRGGLSTCTTLLKKTRK